jgi:hypothetical protein
MLDADEFDPKRWEMGDHSMEITHPSPPRGRSRIRKADRFLKGPVPWSWLTRAMALPGKALALGLMVWLQSGISGKKTVQFCLTRADAEGIEIKTARRAIRHLESAGLITVVRRPGRGLEVTIVDVSKE